MPTAEKIKNVLVFSFLLETLCVTYALYIPAITPFATILYTLCGITIAVCFLWRGKKVPAPRMSFRLFNVEIKWHKWLLMGIAITVMIYFSNKWIQDSPLDYHDADMLPIIKKMCERMLAGNWSQVYDPIPEIWGGIQPIYLSAIWMPFCLPVILQVDLRWVSVLSLFIVFAMVIWRSDLLRKHSWSVSLCAFLLFWWIFTNDRAGLIPYTEEGIVVLYYVLLVMSLNTRKAWLIGLCTSLCVLSRYALIGWLPVMVIYYIWQKEWKQMAVFITAGMICFITLVLAPFGWDTFVKHIALPAEYIDFTARVWKDSPNVFTDGMGWAKFFGPQNIPLLHYLLIILSFSVPIIFFIAAVWLQRKYKFAKENIPLAVLKITIVVFYNFIDVPYMYLFYTSSFVSLAGIVYLVNAGWKEHSFATEKRRH